MSTSKPTSTSFKHFLGKFPRQHLWLAAIALCMLSTALLLTPTEQAQANRSSQPISLELPAQTEQEVATAPKEAPLTPAPVELYSWKQASVKQGDNLSTVFKRVGLSAGTLHQLVNSSKKAKQLTNIYPGQELSFQIDEKGRLQGLKHHHNRLESTLYERTADGFSHRELVREPEIRQRYATATISNSLYRSAQNVELTDSLIMEMANIFGGVIDFVYDVRRGDSFSILYEEKYLDGEKIGNGNILAAQFHNQGELHTAFRYQYANGDIGYYTDQGVSMRKAFLRSPVDFTRISSNFNPKRLHPIFKTKRPHRGIDYAAPRGTPVYAAGDGRVVRAGYSKANGNYVVIQHGQQYTTKYLHLHRRSVKKGQKVKQRQIIGSVGSTGYATGPHLHYEFIINGVHRNPRTIINKLPKAKSITNIAEKQRFLAQIKGLQLQLAGYNSHYQLAQSQSDSKTL